MYELIHLYFMFISVYDCVIVRLCVFGRVPLCAHHSFVFFACAVVTVDDCRCPIDNSVSINSKNHPRIPFNIQRYFCS